MYLVPDDGTQVTVEKALELGCRHIDTAAAYDNEAGVGAALRAGGLPREEVFVTTKLRNGEQGYEAAVQMAAVDRLDARDGRLGSDPATAAFTQFRH